MQYTLGLDIGSTSIGWVVLNNGEAPKLINTGVRIFPEGVDRDTQGMEQPKNAVRRAARGARRTRSRRTLRREQLVRTLTVSGMLPNDATAFRTLLAKEPYSLRAKGLDEQLSLDEFGRVLYHINQRRGFKSNRKSGKEKDGVVNKEATEIQKRIDAKGCRTLGEYLSTLDSNMQRIRAHYTFRSMYEKEFDLLWEKQAVFYPTVLTKELQKKIRDEIIFYQRPLKPTEKMIGECKLEPGEKRCPKADWYARRFRLLQDVNNLLIRNPGGIETPLTPEQRTTLLEELGSKKTMTFANMRKKLGLLEKQKFNFEENGKKESMAGNSFVVEMQNKKLFGKKWDELDGATKLKLNEDMIELEDDELVKMAKEKFNFSDEQTQVLLKVSMPQGYMSFSRKAIQKLLPLMEQGMRIDQAKALVYTPTAKSKDDARQSLDVDLLPQLRNPIVQKALYEVRKVVNALIREYGKPEKIQIEMARDLKNSKARREEIQQQNWANKKENDDARKRLMEDVNIANPTRDDILKYKLWKECGGVSPYPHGDKSKSIGLWELFGDHPVYQVEHILPYSRSLDDSFMNKTLCHVDLNREKGDMTPKEFFGENEELIKRIAHLPWPKRRRFTQDKIDLDKCIERQLNDTRYICREVVAYLGSLGAIVKGTRGEATAILRHQWGLNETLDGSLVKNRDDHRHHAIDAIVTALTSNLHLRNLARVRYAPVRTKLDEPWTGFRDEVAAKINVINVSHRVTKKVSGQLHEETSYGPTGRKDENGQDIFVYRKPLEALTPAMAGKIIDPVVREIVQKRLEKFGIDTSKGSAKISKEVWKEPLYMKSLNSKQVPIKKVRIGDVFNNMIMIKDAEGRPYRAVAPGSNHHIEIFEHKDKKGNIKRDGRVITMFDTVQRSQRGEPVVRRDYGDRKKFVCSLAINEMFMLELEDGSKALHRVQKISQNGTIILRSHTYAGKLSDSDRPPLIQRKSPNTLKGYKATVDPLGRIWPAND